MCYTAVHRWFLVFDSIPDQNKTQEICDMLVSLYPFLIVHYSNKYITQRMCDEAANDSLASLKLTPDWFVTTKMTRKVFAALYTDDGLLFVDKDCGDVTFFCDEMGILTVNLNNINQDDNFHEDDPDTIILIRLLV